MSVRTSSTLLSCSKRCKYSPSVSKEPSEICVENNSSFNGAALRTTNIEYNSGSKNNFSSRLNESEIHETLQEIKSEVCNSNFMLSNAINGFKENEILKTLWEMKAEHCNFQKEVLTRLLSIEKEVNNLKNALCLSGLLKTHIRSTGPDASVPFVETEKNALRKSVCPCKHPEMQTAECKTKPSVIYLEPPCETEISHIGLCMCKLHETQIVRSTKSSIIETPSETEINNAGNVLCTCTNPTTQIVRGNTKPSITETLSEIEMNNMSNSLCMCNHHETQIIRSTKRPQVQETPGETEINNMSYAQCMCKHHEIQIVRASAKSSITETPNETEMNNMSNALCMCNHNKTQIVRGTTRPSIVEPSSETEINQSENSLCMYRHSEISVPNEIVRPSTQNSCAETDEIDTKDVLFVYRNPDSSIVSVARRSGLPKLPIDSTDSLQSVEEWLEDKDNVLILTRHFCSIGGDNVKDTTKRILSRSFTQNIAENINWTGKNHKYPLSKGCLAKVIIAAVKLTHKYENVTEKLVEEHIKAWFRFAKDRDGGRERRRNANISLMEKLLF